MGVRVWRGRIGERDDGQFCNIKEIKDLKILNLQKLNLSRERVIWVAHPSQSPFYICLNCYVNFGIEIAYLIDLYYVKNNKFLYFS